MCVLVDLACTAAMMSDLSTWPRRASSISSMAACMRSSAFRASRGEYVGPLRAANWALYVARLSATDTSDADIVAAASTDVIPTGNRALHCTLQCTALRIRWNRPRRDLKLRRSYGSDREKAEFCQQYRPVGECHSHCQLHPVCVCTHTVLRRSPVHGVTVGGTLDERR